MPPKLTTSAPEVGEPGKSGQENLELMEYYYNSRPNERRDMKYLRELWMDRRETANQSMLQHSKEEASLT